MTPGARLAAAIDLLSVIDGSQAPADTLVADYFRARRYAGSKDRGAITTIVYGVLRRRVSLDERLRLCGLEPNARTRALAWLGHPIDDAAWTPPHCPALLTDHERSALALPVPPPSPAAGVELPDWLYQAFVRDFGAAAEAEAVALLAEAPVDLRVLGGLSAVASARAALAEAGLVATSTPWSPVGLRLQARAPLGLLRHMGAIEVQDEGSQLAARLVDAKPGHRVLDRCAGAGGKSLAIADDTRGSATILASDVTPRRLDGVLERARRASLQGITVRAAASGEAATLGRDFDRVLVDAPCSGSGTFRRSPDARLRLLPETVARLAATQSAILDDVAPLVRPGGRLVYVTCSVLRAENHDVVAAFLNRNSDFQPIPARAVWDASGLGPAPESAFDGPWLQLTPNRSGTDGFFVAILERAAR